MFRDSRGGSEVITEGDNITYCVKGGVSKIHQQFLFLCDANEESDGQLRNWLREHRIPEVNVANCKKRTAASGRTFKFF